MLAWASELGVCSPLSSKLREEREVKNEQGKISSDHLSAQTPPSVLKLEE